MILKNFWSIHQEEKELKNDFYLKTDTLLSRVLTNISSDTIIHAEGKELKVIYAANDNKSLLIEKRPLSTFEDYEWIVDNIPAIVSAVEEIEIMQIAEIEITIEKTKKAIEKVEKINTDLQTAP